MPLACGNVLAGVVSGRVSGAAYLAEGARHGCAGLVAVRVGAIPHAAWPRVSSGGGG
jgi:hypothetical protein